MLFADLGDFLGRFLVMLVVFLWGIGWLLGQIAKSNHGKAAAKVGLAELFKAFFGK